MNQLSLAELQALNDHFTADIFEAITLTATLDCHDVPGGTATHRVRQALAGARSRLASLNLAGSSNPSLSSSGKAEEAGDDLSSKAPAHV